MLAFSRRVEVSKVTLVFGFTTCKAMVAGDLLLPRSMGISFSPPFPHNQPILWYSSGVSAWGDSQYQERIVVSREFRSFLQSGNIFIQREGSFRRDKDAERKLQLVLVERDEPLQSLDGPEQTFGWKTLQTLYNTEEVRVFLRAV
jgi:hypothetical protein